MKKMLEKDIESKVCTYAEEKGLLQYKFTSPMRAAVPDRMFIVPGGKLFFIEFKREGAAPTPQQVREHARLVTWGVAVYLIDTVTDGKAVVDRYASSSSL